MSKKKRRKAYGRHYQQACRDRSCRLTYYGRCFRAEKALAQQYEEAVQQFDFTIDTEIQNRSDTIRRELEVQMKQELEKQRNEAEQVLTRLEAYYTKCHTDMAKEIYDRILRM